MISKVNILDNLIISIFLQTYLSDLTYLLTVYNATSLDRVHELRNL
jgi:hypothetical protein